MDINPDTVAAVLEWRELGANLGGIANAMEAEGRRLPRGASAWNSATVRAILEAVEARSK